MRDVSKMFEILDTLAMIEDGNAQLQRFMARAGGADADADAEDYLAFVNHQIDLLEDAGLVRRFEGYDDSCPNSVSITMKGYDFIANFDTQEKRNRFKWLVNQGYAFNGIKTVEEQWKEDDQDE